MLGGAAAAGRLFDHLLTHPEAWRMGMWLQLERSAAGPDEGAGYAEKIEAMTGGRRGSSLNVHRETIVEAVRRMCT